MLLQRDKILERLGKGTVLLENVKSESQQIISSLKDIEETDDRQLRDRAIQRAKSWIKKKENQLLDDKRIIKKASFKPERPFKLGERVEISGIDQEGNILMIDEASKTAQVQVGIMKINVPLDSLAFIEQQETEQESHKYSSIVMQKAKEISTELDLRGLTLEEALEKVDKYIDDACLAGVHIVTLIHGKGTGTLRRGIQEMLRKRPNVKSYRSGHFDEGGLGVTVVELR